MAKSSKYSLIKKIGKNIRYYVPDIKAGIFGFLLGVNMLSGCRKNPVSPVENDPPTAFVSAKPEEGNAPLESRFKVWGEDPDEDIKKYSLNIKNAGIYIEKKSPIDTFLTLQNPGDDTAMATVTDSKGQRDKANIALKVLDPEQQGASQTATLQDRVNINYHATVNHTAATLSVFKNGEKIATRLITQPDYSELFTYQKNNQITKGNYVFELGWVNEEKRDTSITTPIVQIPNYNPEVSWNGININFDEDSSKIVPLPKPTDPNPEDNPVNYTSIEAIEGAEKVSLGFNSSNNQLTIQGVKDRYGPYTIRGEFGSAGKGIGSAEKSGEIYPLARVIGQVKNVETGIGCPATVILYKIVGDDTLRIPTKTSDAQARNFTDTNGDFNVKTNERDSDLEELLVMARKGTPGNYEGWVRVRNLDRASRQIPVFVNVVPYGEYSSNPGDFKEFMIQLAKRVIVPVSRFDFEGEWLSSFIPGFTGLEKIIILDHDYFSDGEFKSGRQNIIKDKILSPKDISGVIGFYNIDPGKIVFGNNPSDYTIDSTKLVHNIIANHGIIVVVPRSNLSKSGIAYPDKKGLSLVSRGTIYLHSDLNNENLNHTLSHEFGHMFIGMGHPTALGPGQSVMDTTITLPTTGPADKKAGWINYGYITKLHGQVYPSVDLFNNFLRDNYK